MSNIETLCLNCMKDKGCKESCRHCSGVTPKRNAIALPFKTLLNNRFLIGPVLGKPGGFGVTYLAWDMLLDTTAAIKEFLPLSSVSRDVDNISVRTNSKQDQDFYRQGLQIFLKEAKTLAQFSHPNIVRIRDYFTANNTAYLVMEYHNGRPLDQVISDAGGRLSEDRALEIMLPILDGLGAVHKKGFLHRDIKPQNIYLTDKGVPILLDFGASRFAVVDSNQTLTVMLSTGYAPFEQYHKKGKQGPWSDIYSCAATLFFMVTGHKPVDAIERQHDESLVSPNKYNPQLSESFCLSIVKALAINPLARPQNINSFKQIISGNSYLPSAANITETNAQPVLLSPQVKAVKKADRESVVIQYDARHASPVSSHRVIYSILAAIVIWFGLDSRQSSKEIMTKMPGKRVIQEQLIEDPIKELPRVLINDQNENRKLIRVASTVNIDRHNRENVQHSPPQTMYPALPLNPPYQQRWAEPAQAGFISKPEPPGISKVALALNACKYKQQHVRCQFDLQGGRQYGICLPIDNKKLTCRPEPPASGRHPLRPKQRH